MFKFLTGLVILASLLLTGCGTFDVDVKSSQTLYVYQKDINEATRYNAGSDWFYKLPFEAEYKGIFIDYGITETPFESIYVIESGDTKISIPVKAIIQHRLIRNPEDNGNMPYSQDKHVKYFTSIVSSKLYDSSTLYQKLLKETEDSVFRNAFRETDENGKLVYDSFDKVELSIPQIRDKVSKELKLAASKHFIDIVGVRIEDLVVPVPITEAREENLKLQQSELNKTLEIQMQLRLASASLVKRVREALNDVIVDNIVAGQVDKGYLLIKVFQEAASSGQLNVSFTPDFMRYIENGGSDTKNDKSLEESRKMFDKLRTMTNEEMMDYFSGKEINTQL